MDIYIKDKSLLDKITIHFNEVEDKNNGLSYIGKCTFKPKQPFQPIIRISDYAIRLSSNAYILRGTKQFNSYEKYKYKVIFHELAHIARTYNDPEEFRIMTMDNKEHFDKNEEDTVNAIDDEFLKKKNII